MLVFVQEVSMKESEMMLFKTVEVIGEIAQ